MWPHIRRRVPNLRRTNVYVDGFNLYHGALEHRFPGCKWLDLHALCDRVLPKDNVHRIRYFTAKVFSRAHDPQQPVRQATYWRALDTAPKVSIHLGQFKERKKKMRLVTPPPTGPKSVWVYRTEEKGSDVNLASYLLWDAFRGDCDVAVVISNDADLKEPIEMAMREAGIIVGVINPHPAKKRSRDLNPTFFKQLRQGPLRACQFPSSMEDEKGTIRKPTGW